MTQRFKIVFICSAFVYLVDAVCRSIIVYGLFKKSIYYQLGGVVGTIIVSTFLTTTLLVLIPVFRWNAGGEACCETEKLNNATKYEFENATNINVNNIVTL